MVLTKEQISELMRKHVEKENGLHDLMEIVLESMMVAERSEFLSDSPSNKGNGYRPGTVYVHGRKLEFRIPRDRYGNFHPHILAILRNQEEECDRLAGVLYTKGLTQEQVGDVFDEIYGQHYSKSSISRMVDNVRFQVSEWLERGLEKYYPVNDEKNSTLYEKYKELANKEDQVIFGGRLGEYKYYDMDAVIEKAFQMAKQLEI